MRRAYQRMWRVVPCTSRAILMRTESKKDIGEILKTKLHTIQEEEEQEAEPVRVHLQVAKTKSSSKSKRKNKNKRIFSNVAKKRLFSFKESYALLFMAACFASKGSNFDGNGLV